VQTAAYRRENATLGLLEGKDGRASTTQSSRPAFIRIRLYSRDVSNTLTKG